MSLNADAGGLPGDLRLVVEGEATGVQSLTYNDTRGLRMKIWIKPLTARRSG